MWHSSSLNFSPKFSAYPTGPSLRKLTHPDFVTCCLRNSVTVVFSVLFALSTANDSSTLTEYKGSKRTWKRASTSDSWQAFTATAVGLHALLSRSNTFANIYRTLSDSDPHSPNVHEQQTNNDFGPRAPTSLTGITKIHLRLVSHEQICKNRLKAHFRKTESAVLIFRVEATVKMITPSITLPKRTTRKLEATRPLIDQGLTHNASPKWFNFLFHNRISPVHSWFWHIFNKFHFVKFYTVNRDWHIWSIYWSEQSNEDGRQKWELLTHTLGRRLEKLSSVGPKTLSKRFMDVYFDAGFEGFQGHGQLNALQTKTQQTRPVLEQRCVPELV